MKIQDLGVSLTRNYRADEISVELYAKALVTDGEEPAGPYARRMMQVWRENYAKHKEFGEFLKSLDWDIGYLSPKLFRVQDEAVSSTFIPIYKKIQTNFPELSRNLDYDTRSQLEKLSSAITRIAK